MNTIASITFTTPLMLLGMAGAALPIAAHLLHRRTRRRIVFPTIRLLRESSASQSRLFRFRRWLLLVMRCLAIALIAWAFAQPVWRDSNAPSGSPAKGVAMVIIVDTSASSSQQSEGVSLINSMRAMAGRALDTLKEGADQADIVYASARPVAAFPQLSSNLPAVRQELKQLASTQERANLTEAIALAGKLLAGHQGQRHLVILSDMQRANWSDVTLAGPAGQLPEGTLVTVQPVGGGAVENTSLSAPRSFPVRPIANQPVQLVVHVANYAGRDRTIPVEATLDSRPIGTRSIDLKAWDAGDVTFETVLPSQGQHRVVFSAPPDALACDNQAFVTINAVRRVPVVVVGDDNPNQPGSSAYFIIRALAPRGDMGDDLEIRHLASADVSYARLTGAEAVFVGYVGELSSEALQALHMYANQGGGVLVFCGEGDNVAKNLLNLNGLVKHAELLPWIPGPPRDLAKDGGFLQISSDRWDSELLTDFDEQSRYALGQIRFGRVWSTGPLRPGAKAILTYGDGTPALSAQPVGAGRLLVANFSPALACSDLGKYGSFVALSQSLVHYLRPRQDRLAEAAIGEPFNYPAILETAGSAEPLKVFGPDERECEISVAREGSYLQVHLNRPMVSGFYRVAQADRAMATAGINVNAREGDLRRMDADVLREHLRSDGVSLDVRGSQQEGPVVRVRGLPLWPPLVAAAMAVLGMELVLLIIWKR